MKYSNEIPKKVYSKSPYIYINVDVRETTEEELAALLPEDMDMAEEFANEHKYCYYQAKVLMGAWCYDKAVDAIITTRYPNDKMQAVINNYLLDPEDPEALQEFNEMQEFRQMAKQFAKEITNKSSAV